MHSAEHVLAWSSHMSAASTFRGLALLGSGVGTVRTGARESVLRVLKGAHARQFGRRHSPPSMLCKLISTVCAVYTPVCAKMQCA